MKAPLEDPLYYLHNFQRVLDWVALRYPDLLDDREQAFITAFAELPQSSRALLVRLVMRKGEVFRASKLVYGEIGCPRAAASPLVELGWLLADPELHLIELFALLRKEELLGCFGNRLPKAGRKEDWLARLEAEQATPLAFSGWTGSVPELVAEGVWRLTLMDLCDRLRLLFFGNLHQDWTDFVLADLGIFQYETVAFSAASRAFGQRHEVDAYLHIQRCRQALRDGLPAAELLPLLPAERFANTWLELRRGKLLHELAQHHERLGELAQAQALYAASAHPESRIRALRMLERLEDWPAAQALAEAIVAAPAHDAERQQVARILPRLVRKQGGPPNKRRPASPVERLDFELVNDGLRRVEWLVREHLGREDAPVHYVENTLLTSLFGLLCWDAIFLAIPGAFFHPYQREPADLRLPGFRERRAEAFAACLARLDDGSYPTVIRERFASKRGLASPFVAWGILSSELLDQALACLPAQHLRLCFERLLEDPENNRTGLPDLIQFWPAQGRYRMIEVKGPGDRLQDNQRRWLDFFAAHDIPVSVCHVQWQVAATSA